MYKYIACNIIVFILIVAILSWQSISRFNEFKAYHFAIAVESASAAAKELSVFLTEKKRLVEIFGHDHAELINSISENPDDVALQDKLKERILLHFPDYFAFTIADTKGEPYFEDFNGYIDEICVRDIKEFSRTNFQFQQIHPNPYAYHFDVLAHVKNSTINKIFFMSFHSDILGTILNNTQTPGHELMLVLPDQSYLIEANQLGSRINIDRDDYHLGTTEKEHILFQTRIPGSKWSIVDIHKINLFTDFRNKLLIDNIALLMLIIVLVGYMITWVNTNRGNTNETKK